MVAVSCKSSRIVLQETCIGCCVAREFVLQGVNELQLTGDACEVVFIVLQVSNNNAIVEQ